jgi:hypothetical protein
MVIMFDVNGTLTDPSGLGEPWGRPELEIAILRSAMHDALTGAYRSFPQQPARWRPRRRRTRPGTRGRA